MQILRKVIGAIIATINLIDTCNVTVYIRYD